eukprot:gene11585-4829_t
MFESFDSSLLPISKSQRDEDEEEDKIEYLFQSEEMKATKNNCFSIFKRILLQVAPDNIIAKDLPRLVNNITIENSKDQEEITKQSHKVLYNLSKFLNSEKLTEPKKFQEIVGGLKSEYKHLFEFMLDFYGEDSKELLILRSITQKCLAQPMIYLKKLLYSAGISFRDRKWLIDIKRQNDQIVVTHTRTEKVDSKIPESETSIHYKSFFTFTWKMCIFIKESKDTLSFDKARFEFVSLDNYDATVADETDFKEPVLKELFLDAFDTMSTDFDLTEKNDEE